MSVNGPAWSPEEDAILLANATLPTRELAALIPGRGMDSIQKRRKRIVPAEIFARPGGRWTQAEDDFIRANVDRTSVYIAERLPHRTVEAVTSRRVDIGCKYVAAQGWHAKASRARANNAAHATETIRVAGLSQRLGDEGTSYRTASGWPARIVRGFPMPDIPSLYGTSP